MGFLKSKAAKDGTGLPDKHRETFVPERFRKRVELHCLGNALDIDGFPAVMCIVGKPGMGKTWQLRECLGSLGIEVFSVSASRLEDERAGEPAKHLERTYLEAGACKRAGRPAAVVIDDFDTTVGEWEDNTGTVNHQTILALLMHIAECPTRIDEVGETERVPVFVTANRADRIYAPLMRCGRTDVFVWDPDPEERAGVVASILGINRGRTAVADELARAYPDEPLSFFSHLRARQRAGVLGVLAEGEDLRSLLRDEEALRDFGNAYAGAGRDVDWREAARLFAEERRSAAIQ